MSIEEAILEKLRALPPDKQEDVLKFAGSLISPAPLKPLRDPEGLWAHLGIDISGEDIDELRREMWKNFPRNDI
ncbi:MAG: hypothetical protein IT165_01620 [Bryobacterales bacterium]|nr:hypothetical protein [Bryobacterales bacterium]